MPAANPGRANVNREGKGTGKRRVKRIKRQTAARTAGPPAPKPTPTVAPADRTQERAERRADQIKNSRSLSPDRQDTKRSPAQQKRDAQVVAENVRESRRKVVVKRGRGAGVRAALAVPKIMAEGLGNVANATDKGVTQATTGPRLTSSPRRASAGIPVSSLPGRAAKDFVNLPAVAVPSGFDTGAAVVEAVQGKPKRLKRIVDEAKQSDPVYNAAAAGVEKLKGNEKAAASHWKKAVESVSEHPGYAIAEVAGARGAVGTGAGRVARTGALGKRVKRAASTERAPKTLEGTSITVPREYSPDVFRKAGQVMRHKSSSSPDKDQVTVDDINRRVDERVSVSGTDTEPFLGEFAHKRNGKVQLLTPRQVPARAAELKARTGHDFEPVRVGQRQVLVPAQALKRLDEHRNVKPDTTFGKALEVTNDAFRRTVLSTSTSWAMGNLAEGAARAAINRAGPRSYITGRRVVRRVKQLDPAKADELASRILDGGHYSLAEKMQVQQVAHNFAGTKLQPLADALHKTFQTHGPKEAAGAWRLWTESVFHGMRKLEKQFQYAHLGAELRRSPLMSDRLIKLSGKAFDDAAKGLTDTENQVRFARAVQKAYGKYSAYSPSVRHIMAAYSPFAAWFMSALEFVGKTLPKDHPVLTGLTAASANATEEWRKKYGLDLWAEGSVPGFLQASVPWGDDGEFVRAGRYTPFGAFTDLGETLAGQVNPLFSGPVMALQGLTWSGSRIKHDKDATEGEKQRDNVLTALGQFLDSTIPVVAQAKRIHDKGPEALNPLRPTQNSVKKAQSDLKDAQDKLHAIPPDKRTGKEYAQLVDEYRAALTAYRRALRVKVRKKSSGRVKVPGISGRVTVPDFDFGTGTGGDFDFSG